MNQAVLRAKETQITQTPFGRRRSSAGSASTSFILGSLAVGWLRFVSEAALRWGTGPTRDPTNRRPRALATKPPSQPIVRLGRRSLPQVDQPPEKGSFGAL